MWHNMAWHGMATSAIVAVALDSLSEEPSGPALWHGSYLLVICGEGWDLARLSPGMGVGLAQMVVPGTR